MKNKKIAASVFVFFFSVSIFLYLGTDLNLKRNPIATTTELGKRFLKNSLWKEGGEFSLSNQLKKTFFDNAKIWSNFLKSKISENFSEKFSSPNERSFEDRCLTTYNRSFGTSYFEKSQNLEFLKTDEGKEYKTILAYQFEYGKSFAFGFGHEPFEAACCKEKRCFMTNNRSIIPVEDFDAVLMHFRSLKEEDLPPKRKRHQRWIMYEREAPPHSSKTPQIFDGVFNWTMTYRRDSDIVNGYGNVYKKKDFAIEDFSNVERLSYSLDSLLKTKNKMVAWFVSNCKTKSKRREYAEELQRFIQVDIYGGCGLLKCGRRKGDEFCYEKIEKEYKFYLSFENSFCKDYITEKFYQILSYNIIPIVRGSGDYAAIAPPHSYINVEDFRIPRDLANYLYYLHRNETAYLEYFNWRKDYFVMSMANWLDHASSFCTLCQKLHSDKTEKIYYNITEWFYGEARCNKGVRSVRIPPYSKFIK